MSEVEKWRILELRPLRNNVYGILDEVPTKAGAIYLSDQQATPTRIGTIIACGPAAKEVAVGDRFIAGVHSGTNLYLWQYGISDEKWRIFTESEIMAVVEKEIPSEEA